ncbi:MAG: DUF1972 domain-containing protein [Cyclobacteriaceae bacterium]|nr:DUF1972 domain-containing protein [Cyclobacteriaceae bacterium]
MKIAFLGTKGIPNNYGGFEQFAEYISVLLAAKGHEVTVYNPSFHPWSQQKYRGVSIVRISSPENIIGSAANFIYDHLCLKHALQQDYDIIYEAGYHSVAMSYKLLKIKKYQKPIIITNMDGIEWKRSKWNFLVRKLIKSLEKIAVKESPYLISDNPGIRQYYLDEFNRESYFLPYGADPVNEFDEGHLSKHNVNKNNFFLLIARMEPENNIELILESYKKSGHSFPFLVVGNYTNAFGRQMASKYKSGVHFTGGIYNKKELDSLRYFSSAYFHGHSVGGTNPSLLEAMACRSMIVAHDNAFNRGVLGEEAVYFNDERELINHFKSMDQIMFNNAPSFKEKNFQKIIHQYNWELIADQHEELFSSLIKKNL